MQTQGFAAAAPPSAPGAQPVALLEPEPFVIGPYLKEIGRGKDGARALDLARARELFDAVFADRVGELELGGLLIALRVKGETVDEIDAALAALDAHLHRVPVDHGRPAVSIPSYNGARRTANLTPLLACLLADAGVQVVVHGVTRDPGRTTTAEIMQALGMGPCADAAAARAALDAKKPAFVPIEVLSPKLARLLALRWRLGVRNVAHTLAKLLDPTDSPACLRIAAFTHPEFNALQHALFERRRAPALLSRGTEGEVVASTRRVAQIDWVHDGITETVLPAQTEPLREVVELPPAHDARATAQWIGAVLDGAQPVPEGVALQVRAVLQALGQRQDRP